MQQNENRIISWFSCGAASAVATKLALSKYGDRVEIVYQDTGSEHPDNKRFLSDCEKWFDKKISIMKHPVFNNIWEVFEKRRYIEGIGGAPCTSILKRKLAENYIDFGRTIEIFGYTFEEKDRVERFKKNNPERMIEVPLIDNSLNKSDCLGLLDREGVELPVMYKLGFPNNNCIGCPKGGGWILESYKKTFPRSF